MPHMLYALYKPVIFIFLSFFTALGSIICPDSVGSVPGSERADCPDTTEIKLNTVVSFVVGMPFIS
jgi:hypothetical protein